MATIEVNSESKAVAMSAVARERFLQDLKWGEQNWGIEWMSILGEEFGEACQEFNAVHFGGKSPANLRAELVQVAAVAVAIIECLDRKEQKLSKLGTHEAGL